MSAFASHSPFPEKIGKYELLLPIGSGGMATVFLARATGVGGFARDVALKLVHSHLRGDEESKLHLLEEAKLSARIRHPNVVSVQEVDEDPFGLFLVMDYVEGDNLSGLERAAKKAGRPLSDRLIARLLNDALLGLHAAHELCDEDGAQLGIVHRDFTPQNILVSIEGITRLSDFGVAKAADRAVRTKTGLIKGKIAYMAPEQARGHAIDRRCDVWAAGVVAWELIARRRLYTSDDDVATLLRIVTERPPTLAEVIPDISPALDRAVSWALEPDVQRRCPTAETLRAALEAAWAEGEGMADVTELAEFVRQTVGSKLVERKASINEMRSLRLRIGELAVVPDASDSEPTNEYPLSSDISAHKHAPEVSGHSATVPSLPATRISTPPTRPSGAEWPGPGSANPGSANPGLLQPVIGGEPLTQTSAVLPAFIDRTPTRIAWITAALLGTAALLFGLMQFGDHDPPPSAAGSGTASPASSALTTPNPSTIASPPTARVPAAGSAPTPATAQSTSSSTTSDEISSTSSAAAKIRPPTSKRSSRRPAVSKSEPKSAAEKKPGLASSPYATQKSEP